ncbi:MAG: hypothetical protein ABSE48_13850 [Verrucomicrobiota bacterium]|jgi:hypothetical protein
MEETLATEDSQNMQNEKTNPNHDLYSSANAATQLQPGATALGIQTTKIQNPEGMP